MTMIKIAPGGNPATAETPLLKKKPKSSKNKKSHTFFFPVIFILGIIIAWAFMLFLDHFDAFGTNPSFSRSSQELYRPIGESSDYEYDHEWFPHDIEESNGHVIAIEFGEMYSRLGAPDRHLMEVLVVDGQPKILNDVTYTDGAVFVGQEASDLPVSVHRNTIRGIRRIIGRRFSTDPLLVKDIKSLPYEVINKDDKPYIKIHVSLEQVQSHVFKKLKIAAAEYYGEAVTSAVVTVPAYFTDSQRQATKDSARLAGLNVLRLINEPTAAAIGHEAQSGKVLYEGDEKHVLVLHIEGDHIDITISSTEEGVFEILGTAHEEFSLPSPEGSERNYKQQVEDLSHITEEQQKRTSKLIADRCITNIKHVLKQTKLQKSDLSILITTGDPDQVSLIRPHLEAFFNGKKFLDSGLSSDLAVLRGAVQQASILSGQDDGGWVGAFDVTALSWGVEIEGGLMHVLVRRNSIMPTRKIVNVTTIHDNQTKMVFNIYEGERAFVKDNVLVGEFEIKGLERRAKGEVKVELGMEVDPEGRLVVSATEIGGRRSEVEGVAMVKKDLGKRHEGKYDWALIEQSLENAEKYREEDEMERAKLVEGIPVGEGREFGFVLIPQVVEEKTRRGWWSGWRS
ncbi:hypothetical protein VTL71DRAFT_3792 [Oculimacula yallundae]|uniref:Uncharacterized protein n=1 Tax=Oculimacula yallundae TaxID=86028 RepID=A0ABR4C5W6_9HELO